MLTRESVARTHVAPLWFSIKWKEGNMGEERIGIVLILSIPFDRNDEHIHAKLHDAVVALLTPGREPPEVGQRVYMTFYDNVADPYAVAIEPAAAAMVKEYKGELTEEMMTELMSGGQRP
jgi:hypothetical protein